MKVHKFEGATMRDAIAKVKAELGDQAVIIATRQIKKGLLGGTAIEISAAVDDGQDEAARAPAFTQAYRAREQYERSERADREPAPDVEKLINPIRSEMRSLRAMVRASDASRGNADLKSEVAELRKLVEQLTTRPAPAPAPTQTASLAKASKVSIPPKRASAALTAPSKGDVLMLVGPTGAGKTTTIAKLAARAALIDGKRVRLITLDNYRVGGVDQIRTFADLIGVPLAVAESPAELAGMLAEDDAYDLTLIDTAGRSPRDTSAIVELAQELPNCPPIEVHVVIPAATSHTVVDAMLTRFAALEPARLLVTKIDEVDVPADLATLPARTGLPITWITTGQAVPEDIEEPTPARLLDLASNGLGTANSSNTRVA